jgi:hypothetical protein
MRRQQGSNLAYELSIVFTSPAKPGHTIRTLRKLKGLVENRLHLIDGGHRQTFQ